MTQKQAEKLKELLAAFRRGMKLARPQTGIYAMVEKDMCVACAVGTILLGAGKMVREGNRVMATQTFRRSHSYVGNVNAMVPTLILTCPCCVTSTMHVGSLAEHLFEWHDWKRPRIVSYLERQIKEAGY